MRTDTRARARIHGNEERCKRDVHLTVLAAFQPVSYTHLDVYKRQTLYICESNLLFDNAIYNDVRDD